MASRSLLTGVLSVSVCTTVGPMSDLPSMLVPLSGTFPGWPVAEQPSVVQSLLVIVALPVAIGVLVGVIALAGALSRRGRGDSVRLDEPLWLGRTNTARHAAVEGSSRAALTTGTDVTDSMIGGASVRW